MVIFLALALTVSNKPMQAQNTGPIAPEAMQFEPVDATDMVNLATGDFSYVLPLLTVPSPEGGYPIAVSYHSGVTMEDEASWVGLGWNINPGAINRNVNQFPDDWTLKTVSSQVYSKSEDKEFHKLSADVNVSAFNLSYNTAWTDSKSLGGTIGIGAGYNGISAGISMGSEGVGVYGGYQLGNKSPDRRGGFGISASCNTSGYASAGLSVGLGAQHHKGFGLGSGSVGFSISTEGARGGMNFGSVSTSINASSPSMSNVYRNTLKWTKIPLIIPLPGGNASLSYDYYKYRFEFFHEMDTKVSGSLNMEDSRVLSESWGLQDLDYTQDVMTSTNRDVESYEDNTPCIMLPAYDHYSVSAQGLMGTMQPKLFQSGYLAGKGRVIDWHEGYYSNTVKRRLQYMYRNDYYYNSSSPQEQITRFYFNNQNSSYLEMLTGSIYGIGGGNAGDCIWGYNNNVFMDETLDGNDGYSNNYKRQRKGKIIDFYTNSQIANNEGWIFDNGFINTDCISNSQRVNQNFSDPNGIGAFQITTEDGKTYHYALPVYQYEKFTKEFEIDNANNGFEQMNKNKYAVSWLLTAITGPDYIDLNQNHKVDKEDYGYWVNFEYGLWTNGYHWRKPYTGYEEIEYNTKNFYCWGRKQIYYLDAIKTRSHIAYFVKDIREDGRGKDISFAKEYEKIHKEATVYISSDDGWLPGPEASYFGWKSYILTRDSYSHMNVMHYVLKLKKIILVENESSNQIQPTNINDLHDNPSEEIQGYEAEYKLRAEYNIGGVGANAADYFYKEENVSPNVKIASFTIHNQDNIIDVHDDLSIAESNAIRIITFEHDYDLMEGIPNSGGGRLTLNEIKVIGKNNSMILPPYQFNYIDNSDYAINRKDNYNYDYLKGTNANLNRIITPVGSEINIEYERDKFDNVMADDKLFRKRLIKDVYLSGDETQIIAKIDRAYDKHLHSDMFTSGNSYTLPCFLHQIAGGNTFKIFTEYSYNLLDKAINGDNLLLYFENDYINDPYFGGISEAENKYIVGDLTENLGIGGDVKTTRITINEINSETIKSKTEYFYEDGITSYIPMRNSLFVPFAKFLPAPAVMYKYVTVKNYGEDNNYLGKTFYHFNVLNSDCANVDDPSEIPNHEHLIFGNDDFGIYSTQKETKFDNYNPGDNEGIIIRANRFLIEDNTDALGAVYQVRNYNAQDKVISTIKNEYYDPSVYNLGVNTESFKHIKRFQSYINSSGGKQINYCFINNSSIKKNPLLLKEVHKYSNGVKTTTKYEDYDFLTGKPLKTKYYDSEGSEYMSEVIPAYMIDNGSTFPHYSSMGSKTDDPNNANMLTQEAANYVYVKNGSNWDVLSANIQTWNKGWWYRKYDGSSSSYYYSSHPTYDVWRKKANYMWKGPVKNNGAYDWNGNHGNYDKDFNWANISANAANGWQAVNMVTQYNHYSVPIESKDMNGDFVASQMGYDDSYVLSNVANAKYVEYAYSGAEDLNSFNNYFGSSEVSACNSIINTNPNYVHTGKKSLKVNNSGHKYAFKRYIKSVDNASLNKKYFANVWVHQSNAIDNAILDYQYFDDETSIAYGSVDVSSQTAKFGNWYLLTLEIPPNTSADVLKVSCWTSGSTLYFDDFRVLPFKASMQAYVYDEPTGQVTAIFNDDHLATKYEYDNAGRLIGVYTETKNGFVKSNEYMYNYARDIE